jgi:tetratricopeptide (TPR) repeat protein
MENESQRHRLERCQRDAEEHPERASAHHNLGLAYTVSGRVKKAEESYLKALEIDPSLVQAWVNLGGVRLMRWEFQGCLEANQAAAKLRDDLPIVHYNMGRKGDRARPRERRCTLLRGGGISCCEQPWRRRASSGPGP